MRLLRRSSATAPSLPLDCHLHAHSSTIRPCSWDVEEGLSIPERLRSLEEGELRFWLEVQVPPRSCSERCHSSKLFSVAQELRVNLDQQNVEVEGAGVAGAVGRSEPLTA